MNVSRSRAGFYPEIRLDVTAIAMAKKLHATGSAMCDWEIQPAPELVAEQATAAHIAKEMLDHDSTNRFASLEPPGRSFREVVCLIH